MCECAREVIVHTEHEFLLNKPPHEERHAENDANDNATPALKLSQCARPPPAAAHFPPTQEVLEAESGGLEKAEVGPGR